jgi:hypothetical protein
MSAVSVASKTFSHGQQAPSTLPIDAFFRRDACAELKAQVCERCSKQGAGSTAATKVEYNGD